jgi:hypothetical protein
VAESARSSWDHRPLQIRLKFGNQRPDKWTKPAVIVSVKYSLPSVSASFVIRRYLIPGDVTNRPAGDVKCGGSDRMLSSPSVGSRCLFDHPNKKAALTRDTPETNGNRPRGRIIDCRRRWARCGFVKLEFESGFNRYSSTAVVCLFVQGACSSSCVERIDGTISRSHDPGLIASIPIRFYFVYFKDGAHSTSVFIGCRMYVHRPWNVSSKRKGSLRPFHAIQNSSRPHRVWSSTARQLRVWEGIQTRGSTAGFWALFIALTPVGVNGEYYALHALKSGRWHIHIHECRLNMTWSCQKNCVARNGATVCVSKFEDAFHMKAFCIFWNIRMYSDVNW